VDIDAFLLENDWTEEQLAGAARSTQSTINRLRRKALEAGLELSLRIEAATGGKVTAEEVPMTRETRQALTVVRASATRAQGSAA